MNKIKKIFDHPNFLPLLVVTILGIAASRTLIFQDGYFNMHDDLQMMRQLQLEKCILDGQIPCRWVPDMGYGFGFPLFNFYPPLPYIFGQIFRFIGFSFVSTAKLTFASAIILSGVTMYYWSKEFFGRAGGVLSSAFYIWAPYHAVDIYVRGAMNEAWALVWFPLILLSGYKVVTTDKKEALNWIPILAVAYAFLFLTHNLMVMILTPVFGFWLLIHLWKSKNWKRILPLIISGLWALGMAAFFTLPAMVENQFTQIRGQLIGYYDYTAHFISIKQLLFTNFWGYGPSVWGADDDGMSFQVGYLLWVLSIVVGIVLFWIIYKKYKSLGKKMGKLLNWVREEKFAIVTLYFVLIGWFSAFMTHSRSTPIWKIFTQLGYLQFSWRFLTLVILSFSFVAGVLPLLVKIIKGDRHDKFVNKTNSTFVSIFFTLIIVVFSWNYFLPEKGSMGELTDLQKFSDAAWDLQQTAGIYDYLPSTAIMAPREPMHNLIEYMEGEGNVSDEKLGTNWGSARVDVRSEAASLRVGIFYFPGWRAFIDGVEANLYVPKSEEWGRMYVDLPAGIHNLRFEFINTPIRTYADIISIISWSALFTYPWWMKRIKIS